MKKTLKFAVNHAILLLQGRKGDRLKCGLQGTPIRIGKIGEVKKMKNRLLMLSTVAASLTIAAVCLVVPSNTATGAVVNTQMTVTMPPTGTPPAPTLPYGATEVMKMYQGGIHKDLILNYINNTTLPCHLSADAIIYLQSTGLPQDITQAMIVRDGQLNQMAAANPPMMPPQDQSYPPPMAGQGQVAVPTTPAPDVNGYGYGDYGDYGSPYYDTGSVYYYGGYPYYWGWWPGWGWGWRGWWGGHWGGGFRGGFGRGGFGGGFGRGGFGGFHGGFGGVGGFRGGGFGGGGFHGGFAGSHASAGFGHGGGGFGGGHAGGGGHGGGGGHR
jgi:hypothetical protein